MAENQSRAPQTYTGAEKARRRSEPSSPAPEHAISAESTQIAESSPVSSAVERHAAALGDSRLDHPANAVRRASIAEYVQRTYGNEHMQRVIQQVRVQRAPKKTSETGPAAEQELTSSGLRPNPFGPAIEQEAGTQAPAVEQATKPSSLRPNPFGPAVEQGLTPSGLRPNPFGPTIEQEAGTQAPAVEQATKPSSLRPNPFGPAVEQGLTPSGLRPNPFGPAIEQEAGTQAPTVEQATKPSGLRPNPFEPAGEQELTPSGLRPNPFGPAVEQEAGTQAPATRAGGFDPDAAARIRNEILTPIEQAAEEALGASPPDTQRAMRLISQAVYAMANAPLEQRFAARTAAAMRNEVLTPLEEAGELLASGGSPQQAISLLARAIVATSSLRLERRT